MAKKQNSRKEKVNAEAAELTGTENFLDKNKNMFLIIGGGVLAILIGYIGYQKFVKEPKAAESQEELWAAFYDFENDSTANAIDGKDYYMGMSELSEEYSGTTGGDIANYAMGVMKMKDGEFQEALDYLEACSFDDVMVGNLCLGLQGDCLVELEDLDGAAKVFEKAANREINEFTTPMFLKKAGLVREELGDKTAANKHYNRIKEEYSTTDFGTDIDKYIGRTNS
ncbi:MAG: tol-pal system YbgF family protein [Crocinitomicaceae bacterium]